MNDNEELPTDYLDNKLSEWQQYIADRVVEAIERCANICDERAAHYRKTDGLNMEFVDGETLAMDLAQRIRGLK